MYLADLDLAALHLLAAARTAVEVLAGVTFVALDPRLALEAPLSPVTGLTAAASLARAVGPLGLSGDPPMLTGLALATLAATAAYRRAEEDAARTMSLIQNGVMAGVGSQAPRVAVGVLVLGAFGVDIRGVLDRAVYRFPALADLAGGSKGLVVGLESGALTGPFMAVAEGLGPRPAGAAAAQGPARGEEVGAYEDGVRTLTEVAHAWGVLAEGGGAKVTREASPRAGAKAARTLEDLARQQANLSDGEDYPGHVRVTQVPQAHGSAWIVEISGTQGWDVRSGANPFDVTTDVRSMARQSTVLADGVAQALDEAQLEAGRSGADDPVMVTGHSLGGIVATGLAASPEFMARHRVTHVVTMGSPVARMPVPRGVEVLSLEHEQDAVPRLDGAVNPDRKDWVTVTRDLERDPSGVRTAGGAHSVDEYAETAAAVDSSSAPSVVTWREGSRPFFEPVRGHQPVVRDYRIERSGPGG